MAKPKKNNFEDVKMLIATLSITMTLVFWHLFSISAADAEAQVVVANISQTSVTLEPTLTPSLPTPAPTFTGKILFGGEAPQPEIVVQRVEVSRNNNNGGGGGGGVVTQTQSS